jgi:hypothetical protein
VCFEALENSYCKKLASELSDWANLRPIGKLQTLPKFLGYFFHSEEYSIILLKMCWARFRAIFSQTHLVTMVW